MNKQCQNCGAALVNPNAKFCDNCGATLNKEVEEIETLDVEIKKDNNESNKQTNTGEKKNYKNLLNIDPCVEALLSYLIPFIGLIALFVKGKEYDEFSLFHYKQSATILLIEIAVGLISSIFSFVMVFSFLGGILEAGILIIAVLGGIKAYQGEKFEIPIIKEITPKIWKN